MFDNLFGVGIGAVLGVALGVYGKRKEPTCPLTGSWWRGALYGALMGGLLTIAYLRTIHAI